MDQSSIFSLVFFFVTILGFGYSLLWLVKAKRQENPILAVVEMAAIGLAIFAFLGVIFNLLHIPVYFITYIILSLICPIIALIQALRKGSSPINMKWKSEETICAILLIIVVAATFGLMLKGALSYPYLEDDDPWNHAQSAVYIGRTMTYSVDPQIAATNPGYVFYIEPYPPTYDTMMGVLWQTNGDILWTLKFFNALLVGIALAFVYLFVKAYLGSDLKALFATIILAALPSFMGHFIWSQTLALVLFPIALYAIIKALNDNAWIIPAIVAVASEMVSQPVVSAVFGATMLLLALVIFIHELVQKEDGARQDEKQQTKQQAKQQAKKSEKSAISRLRERFRQTIAIIIIGAAGLALSLLYWGKEVVKWGLSGVVNGHSGGFSGWNMAYVLQKYTFWDVVNPSLANMRIDQAIGWGIIVSCLFLLSIIVLIATAKQSLSVRKSWLNWHILLWFLLTAWLVFGPTLNIPSYGSSRAWPYLAIPLAILVTQGVFIIANSIAGKRPLVKLAVLLILAVGIIVTAAPTKIAVQGAPWGQGARWTVQSEFDGYLQTSAALPKDTRIFPFCQGYPGVIGLNMQADPWDPEEVSFHTAVENESGDAIVSFLHNHKYEYAVIDASCISAWGPNATQDFAVRLGGTGKFQQVIAEPGFLLMRVS